MVVGHTVPSASRVTVVSGGGATTTPGPRSQIGRYAIEGLLGAGGMAVVYLARDPVLGRAVALKVMRVGDEPGASRLVREGQALARISHPNVISVYEVGREADGLIYIAMERIVGVTLTQWLETPRTRREILDAFAAAGRGLSAAHAAGLVHRDFKPDNVMVGDDGRVCVLDFGLARAMPTSGDAADAPGHDAGDAARDGLAVTAGSAAGTPAYMSPEQWRGERAVAASDQFSFCVALWRALTGEHPFDLGSREALRGAVIAGQIRRPPPILPRRLRGVLRRGLAIDPRDRFASIDAIVGELACRRRRWWIPALAAVAAAAAITAHLIALPRDRAPHTAPRAAPAAPPASASRGDVARGAAAPLPTPRRRSTRSPRPRRADVRCPDRSRACER
jgi:eukaryotic-like serine/threonine-protein kinase